MMGVLLPEAEAKKIGIKMGEPYFKIKNIAKKNNIKVFSSNYALYGDISRRVIPILKSFSDKIEIYSIDEAFLDLTNMPIQNMESFILGVKKTIYQYTGIPVSIGVANNKTLSKVANYLAKKNTQGVVDLSIKNQEEIDMILKGIEVENIWGVGRQLSKLYQYNGIKTAYQLKYSNFSWIRKNTNVFGLKTVMELKGIVCNELETSGKRKKKKLLCFEVFWKKNRIF